MGSLLDVLKGQAQGIISASADALERSREPHYAQQGAESSRERLARLLELVTVSVEQRDLVPMIGYATTVANERFDAGFDIRELQRAFHVLEEAIWERVVDSVPHEELAVSPGLVGTVVSAGRPPAPPPPASSDAGHDNGFAEPPANSCGPGDRGRAQTGRRDERRRRPRRRCNHD